MGITWREINKNKIKIISYCENQAKKTTQYLHDITRQLDR